MRNGMRRFWVLLPIVASLATECDETPRGAVPTSIATVDLVLTSRPAPPPPNEADYEACLARMDNLPNHVRPSWRATVAQPTGTPVLFTEGSPNIFEVRFADVPVDYLNTMTVHDVNECARDPQGDGHVTMGVTVNGTAVTTVVGPNDDTLAFELNADGTVSPLSTTMP